MAGLSRRSSLTALFSSLVLGTFTRSALGQEKAKIVAIGGVDGFESLADPQASSQLRATGRARLYVHDYIWQRLSVPERVKIVAAFNSTGPASIEIGVSSHAGKFWQQHFQTYKEAGLSVDQAYVNLATGSNALSNVQWRSLVDAGKSFGLKVVAPIFAPNLREWMKLTFSDSAWDGLKGMAEYGGGLTIDSPPWYFFTHPVGYRRFVEDEIIWARSNGLKSAWIISPPRTANGEFESQTQKLLYQLAAANSLPDDYVLENYMARPPNGFRFVVGTDHTPETIGSTALWVARNCCRFRGDMGN